LYGALAPLIDPNVDVAVPRLSLALLLICDEGERIAQYLLVVM